MKSCTYFTGIFIFELISLKVKVTLFPSMNIQSLIVLCTPADRHQKQFCESYCFSQACCNWYLAIVSQNFLRRFDQFPLNDFFLQVPFRKRCCKKSLWLSIRLVTGRTPGCGGFDRISVVGKIPFLLRNLIRYSIWFIFAHFLFKIRLLIGEIVFDHPLKSTKLHEVNIIARADRYSLS